MAAASLFLTSDSVQSREPGDVQKELAFAQVRRPLQGPVAPKKLFPQTATLPTTAAFVQPSVLQLNLDVGITSAQQRAFNVAVAGTHEVVEPPVVAPKAAINPPLHGVLENTWITKAYRL